jgi:hypothetical protein
MTLYWIKFKDILWWHDTVFKAVFGTITAFWNRILLLSLCGEVVKRFDCWLLSTSLWKCMKYILRSLLWVSCTWCTWCTCTPTHVTVADLVYIGHLSVTCIQDISACVRKLNFSLLRRIGNIPILLGHNTAYCCDLLVSYLHLLFSCSYVSPLNW